MKTKPGRPPKLTDETAAVIIAAVRSGMSVRAAADLAHVGRSTVMKWIAQGRNEKRGRFRDLIDRITRARAELVREALQVIRDAIDGKLTPRRITKVITDAVGQKAEVTTITEPPDWRAAAWLLERRFRDEFSSNAKELRELKAVIKYLVKLIEANGMKIVNTEQPMTNQ